MLSQEMLKSLNSQLHAEFASAYLYLAMAAYFDGSAMPGAANWMQGQVQEELMHGMKFFDYLGDRDGAVELATIEKPSAAWKSPLEAFQDAYKHEQEVTARIHKLVALATNDQDHATATFLQWFVTEQVEEERTLRDILDQFKLVGDNSYGVYMIDRNLKRPGSATEAQASE